MYPKQPVQQRKSTHEHCTNCVTNSTMDKLQLCIDSRHETTGASEKRYNFKISSLFQRQIKKCPGTKSPILSHHKFLMGSLDDSCQSNICSAFPLSRGAPVDLYLTFASQQYGGREGLWFPVSHRRTEETRKRWFYDHCLPWWSPASFPLFFP